MTDKQNFLDNCFNKLLLLKDNNLRKEIVENFPVIISIGDQSSGKSSIFSRIINQKLPTKDGVCTRVPVMICTRRKKSKNTVKVNNKEFSQKNITDAVLKAQEFCLEGQEFSTNMIKIHIYSQKYDLTFIDLPGLVAKNTHEPDHPQNKVYEILDKIKQEYKKSIIFHIMDSNTEVEKSQSVIELNEILKKDPYRKICTIYTKSDLLENIEKFEELDQKVKGTKFVMTGKEDTHEKDLLDLETGIDAVLDYINSINEQNISENYDIFKNKINLIQQELQQKLENELKPFNEVEEKINTIQKIKTKFTKEFKMYTKQYKKEKENLFCDLKELRAFDDYIYLEIEEFMELNVGDIIYYFDNFSFKKIKSCITKVTFEYIQFHKEYIDGMEESKNEIYSENEVYTYYFDDEWKKNNTKFADLRYKECRRIQYSQSTSVNVCAKFKNEEYTYIDMYNGNCKCGKRTCEFQKIHDDTGKFWVQLPPINVIDQIKTILENIGGLEPDIMKESKQVVHHFAFHFAQKYKEKMELFLKERKVAILSIVNEIQEPEIYNVFTEVVTKIETSILVDIHKLYLKNANYDLLSTPNNHYLSENILRAIKRQNTLAEDDAYYKIANCEIEGFIKVQMKYIIERADDIFNYYFFYVVKQMFCHFDSIDNKTIELLPLKNIYSILNVKDTPHRQRLRDTVLHDHDICQQITAPFF